MTQVLSVDLLSQPQSRLGSVKNQERWMFILEFSMLSGDESGHLWLGFPYKYFSLASENKPTEIRLGYQIGCQMWHDMLLEFLVTLHLLDTHVHHAV